MCRYAAVATFTNLSRAVTYDLYTIVTHVNASAGNAIASLQSASSDTTGPDGSLVYYAEFTRIPEVGLYKLIPAITVWPQCNRYTRRIQL